MTISIIHKSPDAFTDSALAKLQRDPVANNGTLFLFDLLDPYCNPNADGALAQGATFKNLIDGGADGTFTVGTGPTGASIVVANVPGKAGLSSTGQTGNLTVPPTLSLGGAQLTGDKPFVTTLWVKQNGMPFNAANLIGDLRTAGGSAGDTQWAWSLYVPAANQVQAAQRLVGSTAALSSAAPASTAVRQVAVGWSAGTLSLFVNGAPFAILNGIASPVGATGAVPAMFFAAPGTYYRAMMERLDLSGRSALAAVQADYAANNGRFA